MENEMQAIVAPPIQSRSQSRDLEQGRDRIRPEFYSSPQLSPSPFSPEQTSSSISENFSLHPAPSTISSRSRTPTSRSTSPYPSSFISQEPTDSLLPPGQEEGELQRQLSTRLGTATAVRQPSFPQFRNSNITKHSMSLITRPGIVHVRPGQALARNSPTMTSSPLNESITGSPESISIGSMREAQVSVINVSGSPKTGTRTSARASLLAGPGPAIRPSGPMTCIPDNNPTTFSFPSLHSSSDITEEKNRSMDMKIQKILGSRDSA
ncbi:uncharacterized protein PAC_06242 [Phialocephala subalpina]|uniref:Uncharacterized protein n=1 Tax=Phialocephala subalpina TaxID=576137 RepID=A0A1L7WU91_9HELO|nr:uncharacterized protein PAC_06242 [Phialocephala subalpina]